MPLFRRRRPLLRAAAVGGGAYAFGKHRERKQEDEQQQAYDEGQQAATTPGPAPPAPSGITAQDTERLAELGKLHEQGVLTDEEFSQQKAKILGMG
jgi:Short C-terminal domain